VYNSIYKAFKPSIPRNDGAGLKSARLNQVTPAWKHLVDQVASLIDNYRDWTLYSLISAFFEA